MKPVLFLPLILLMPPLDGFPTGTNLSFEDGLDGWTHDGVSVGTSNSFHGSMRLDLGDGYVEQTISALVPGETHTLHLAYISQRGNNIFNNARILIEGEVIGELHTVQLNEYLSANGFEFTPASTNAVLRIESLDSSPPGLLIDAIRLALGTLPDPPAAAWDDLEVISDARGGRLFVNGGFEAALSDHNTDPHNSGPAGNDHLSGFSLPGWLVTRENVDIIQSHDANPPEGANAADVNGHGPGGIAQTITGLEAGHPYTISLFHARHTSWGDDDMTAVVLINDEPAKQLVRTIHQTWDHGYELLEIPAIASQQGTLTLEIRSTITHLGGCITIDDVRISSGADLFAEWAAGHGITADPAANDDHDQFDHGFEFIFGFDPGHGDRLPMLSHGSFVVPLNGTALSQGVEIELFSSTDLSTWLPVSSPESPITLDQDTSARGLDGARTYSIQPGTPRIFWRFARTGP